MLRTSTRISAIVLAAILTLLAATPAMAQAAASFNDVPASHPSAAAIAWVSNPANNVFMMGDAAGNFNPTRTLTNFEAAQVLAMASGFRIVTANLPAAQQAMFERSVNNSRQFLDSMAAGHTAWNRSFDREIAFLLYHNVITETEVLGFVTTSGQTSVANSLTREQAITWVARMAGHSSAAAVTLPHPNPFADDASINANYRRYVYFALNSNFIQRGTGTFNPTQNINRAELATILFNMLNAQSTTTGQTTGAGTVIGVIEAIQGTTQINVRTATALQSVRFTANSIIMIDGQQRPFSALQVGMTVTVLTNAQGEVVSLVGRTDSVHTGAATPAGNLSFDEGFVTAITANGLTIRTQRVRISGEVINEERNFTLAANVLITRGGVAAPFNSVQVGDIAFFRFAGDILHELTLVERERTLVGTLLESRPPETVGGSPTLTVAMPDDRIYELRTIPVTTFTRNGVQNLNWSDIRIGDSVTINAEYDRAVSVVASGVRTTVNGRLTELVIRERNSQITVTRPTGESEIYVVVPGAFDIYSLRIGQTLSVMLDSREVIDIQIQGQSSAQQTVLLGYIQAIHANGNITVVEGQGNARRTINLQLANNATITRAGASLNRNALRVNMNVHVTLTEPQSNTVQAIIILP